MLLSLCIDRGLLCSVEQATPLPRRMDSVDSSPWEEEEPTDCGWKLRPGEPLSHPPCSLCQLGLDSYNWGLGPAWAHIPRVDTLPNASMISTFLPLPHPTPTVQFFRGPGLNMSRRQPAGAARTFCSWGVGERNRTPGWRGRKALIYFLSFEFPPLGASFHFLPVALGSPCCPLQACSHNWGMWAGSKRRGWDPVFVVGFYS